MQADQRDWKLHFWHKVLCKRNEGKIRRVSSFVLAKFRTREMIEFSYNLSKKRSKHRNILRKPNLLIALLVIQNNS